MGMKVTAFCFDGFSMAFLMGHCAGERHLGYPVCRLCDFLFLVVLVMKHVFYLAIARSSQTIIALGVIHGLWRYCQHSPSMTSQLNS